MEQPALSADLKLNPLTSLILNQTVYIRAFLALSRIPPSKRLLLTLLQLSFSFSIHSEISKYMILES